MSTIQILELLVAILGTGTLSALYKNRAEKRKLKSETANNINEMFSRLADDQRAEIEALKADYKALKAENIQIRTCYEELKAENIQLKRALANLEERNEEYRLQAERRKAENIQLKAELEKLGNSVRGLH